MYTKVKAYKNIILDVDGTLWNTTEVVARAWNQAITEEGHSHVRVDAEGLKKQFGKPMDVIAANLFTDVTPEIRAKLLEDCCAKEQQALMETTENLRYPHVKETIQKLKDEKNCRLFIVSNCQTGYIELVIEKNGLEDFISDFECFGNTKKPKGENISFICERNRLKKEETVYVGDTIGDKEAAEAAKIGFIYAAYGFGDVRGTDILINEFQELLEFF
ncbi:MAG: HAD family hydrolase [Lachnospiraceae bacterium]|nr:HAD family hydrolase [Lachnospiraceae bacterium]